MTNDNMTYTWLYGTQWHNWLSLCHWSNFDWLRFPFLKIKNITYNLGKVYISAKQPIEFNSELDDKSRFENVDHLEKYIIWWVNKHFVYKKNGLICDMYDVKTYVDFYFWEYMWLSDWLILCNFTPEMVSIFQDFFFFMNLLWRDCRNLCLSAQLLSQWCDYFSWIFWASHSQSQRHLLKQINIPSLSLSLSLLI